MACNCEEGFINIGEECVKTTIITDIECPPNCTVVILEDGNAKCSCIDSVDPTEEQVKTPVYFDNEEYFKDVSWTISYNASQGSWGSYFSFYPDFSPFNNNYFQVGYNWGEDKGTLWNHTMNNSSFQVFQGKLHPFVIEYPIANENAFKMLNSVSLNIEAKRYNNQWDISTWKGKGFNKLTIWNNTNNSGLLNLVEQKMVSDARKYPKTNSDGTQDILF